MSADLNIKIIIWFCVLQQVLFLDNGVPCAAYCSYRMWLTFPEASCLPLRRYDNRSSYIFSTPAPFGLLSLSMFYSLPIQRGMVGEKAIKLSPLVAVLSGWQNESKKNLSVILLIIPYLNTWCLRTQLVTRKL